MALAGGSLYSTYVLRCCGPYFSLDAAPFTAVWLRFADYPPCFEICAFPSQEHTRIRENFQANLLGPNQANLGPAESGKIYETHLWAFQSKLWPVPTLGLSFALGPTLSDGGVVPPARASCTYLSPTCYYSL